MHATKLEPPTNGVERRDGRRVESSNAPFGDASVPYLELRHVSKDFGPPDRRKKVLHDINLEVGRGEFVAIVGYSGSGKTTLISLVAGLLRPDSGTIMLDGEEIIGPGSDRGVVFQNYSLLPWMSAYENVYLAVDQLSSHWSRLQKQRHTEKYLELVNLAAARDKVPSQLSGGMR